VKKKEERCKKKKKEEKAILSKDFFGLGANSSLFSLSVKLGI